MKQVTILITHQALIAAIGNASHLFYMVNVFLKESGRDAHFNVRLVGLQKEMKLNNGTFTIQADATIDQLAKTDLIIIPPMTGDMENCILLNGKYLPWIHQQFKQGAEVASLCVGSFLLAETGLLDGAECSTHWQSSNEFRMRFPGVQLVDEKIITDHNGLYTSGGANSYWNLLIYLIEKYTDKEMAIRTSKYFEIELNRDSQSLFTIFEGCKFHDDDAIHTAQVHIENYFAEKLIVDQLADLAHVSRRSFQRRFKKATHFSVKEYIQRIRIEAAKKLLEGKKLTVNEIMYQAGYNDPKAFRYVFHKVSGVSPLTYRRKFR